MAKIKVFTGVENDVAEFEDRVNGWLSERGDGLRIIQMCGNIAPQTLARHAATSQTTGRSFNPSDLFVMFLYEQE